MRIGQRVTEARRQLGLNQSQLAAAAGITQATISRIESGQVEGVHSDNLRRLCRALNVSADYLLDITERGGDEMKKCPFKQPAVASYFEYLRGRVDWSHDAAMQEAQRKFGACDGEECQMWTDAMPEHPGPGWCGLIND